MEFQFERNAMLGEQLPKGLDIADSCLYIALKNLYAMYHNRMISRKDASDEKKKLFYNWATDKSKIEFLNRENESLSGRIKEAKEKYAKNPSVETADKLYAAFYNLPDNWRSKDFT